MDLGVRLVPIGNYAGNISGSSCESDRAIAHAKLWTLEDTASERRNTA